MGLFKIFVHKKELEIEIERLKSIIDIERKKLQAEYDILATKKTGELMETMKLAKVDMDDKLKKQCNEYEKALNDLRSIHGREINDLKALHDRAAMNLNTVHAQEISKLESKLAKEYYEQMTQALRDVNLEGSAQTKYVEELSLKFLDKALEKPMPSHIINESRMIAPKCD